MLNILKCSLLLLICPFVDAVDQMNPEALESYYQMLIFLLICRVAGQKRLTAVWVDS